MLPCLSPIMLPEQRFASHYPKHQKGDANYQKKTKNHFCDRRRAGGHAGESEGACHERDNQKNESPSQHRRDPYM
jgi:hypothetical protein